MAKAITREEILSLAKQHEETWVRTKVSQCYNEVIQYTNGELFSVPSTGIHWKFSIPKRYIHLETELYSRLKERFPDCTVHAYVENSRWFFCCKETKLNIKISWQ
jgi:hypothetical protein